MSTGSLVLGVTPPGGPGGSGVPLVRWRGLLLLAALVQTATSSAAGCDDAEGPNSRFIVDRFEDDRWQEFTHLTVDKNTGTVYAGGVNRLYQLEPNLRLLQYVVTGPVNDSVECPASGCFSEDLQSMKPTNNVNKVLMVDYKHSRLIVCGSVRQGSCQVRDLRDIAQLTHNVKRVHRGLHRSGAAQPARHTRALHRRDVHGQVRVQGAGRRLALTGKQPLLGNRRDRRDDEHADVGQLIGAGAIPHHMEDTYAGSPYMSKLVRVCQNDPAYYSYTEIPIECKDQQGKHYNLVQAAYVGKPGADLATQLGIQTNDDVLFAVFSASDPTEGAGSPWPADNSALCVYSMKSVRHVFIKNIEKCFRGEGDRGLNFISPSHYCTEEVSSDIQVLLVLP
ncbi:putative Plexin-A1 precursor [Penaeus vannamei]|uniref:Putative Plexin-A1 n=1 Tax=Penaeus vannamei TaxID=6689 RepID=A0A423TL41_PENVA|nr:putative Plexin-A1 precursor [Penaeus vannamei]